MYILDINDQKRIVRVIDYLVEIQQKSTTVMEVMKRFNLTPEEYRMCSNLAVPALAQVNMTGRYNAVRSVNRAMRSDLKALYENVKDDDSTAATGVKMLYDAYCGSHRNNVVYGSAEDDDAEGEDE